MRNTFILAITLGVVAAFSSCSSSGKHTALLPEDAMAVASIDLLTLTEKGVLEEMQDMRFFKTFKSELKSESRELAKVLEDIMEDPRATGLDFKEKIYFFMLPGKGRGSQPYAALAAAVSDSDKLAKTLEDALDEAHVDFNRDDKNGVEYLDLDGQGLMAWDKGRFLMLFNTGFSDPEDLEDTVESLFEQDKDEQLARMDEFAEFDAEAGDFNIWFSTNTIAEADPGQFRTLQAVLPYDLEDNSIGMHLDFAEDAVLFHTGVIPNESLKKYMKDHPGLNDEPNANALRYLPAKCMAVYGMSMNSENMLESMKNMDEYDQINDEMEDELGFGLESIFNDITGDVVFCLTDVRLKPVTKMEYQYDYDTGEYGYVELEGSEPTPIFAAVVGAKDDRLLKRIMREVPKETYQKEGDYYVIESGDLSIFMGYFDGAVLITNDDEIIEQAEDGGYKSSQSMAGNPVTEHGLFGYADLNIDNYPASIRSALKDEMEDSEYRIFENIMEVFEDLQIHNTDNYNATMTLKVNGDKNSLVDILKAVDRNLSSF